MELSQEDQAGIDYRFYLHFCLQKHMGPWHKVIQHLHSLADVFVLDFWMEMLHNPGPELVPCYLSNCQPSKGRTLQVGPASFPAGQVSAGIYHSFCRDLSFPLQAQGI